MTSPWKPLRTWAAGISGTGGLLLFLTGSGCFPPQGPQPVYDPTKLPQAPRVEIRDNLLVLNQNIFFEFDSDRIKPESYPILDEVARVLRQHAEIGRVRIEGHTDNVGDPGYNLTLSDRRARSVVQYMISKGISGKRVHPMGHGPNQPIAPNETEDGRALNRRVVFAIEEWRGPIAGDGDLRAGAQGPMDPFAQVEPPIVHYATYSGKRLEVGGYGAYQRSRYFWLGGSIATFVGLGFGALGATLLTVGVVNAQNNGLNPLGSELTQGGIGLTILGSLGMGAGITLWVIGHRDLNATEARLQRYVPPSPAPQGAAQ